MLHGKVLDGIRQLKSSRVVLIQRAVKSTKPSKGNSRSMPFAGSRQVKVNPPSAFPVTNSTAKSMGSAKQHFDYLLVLDFEATCQQGAIIHPYQEIIEMPVLALNTATWEVNHRFHQYVRPTARPELTSFCTHLTGIIQEMVDNQQTLPTVLQNFDSWLEENSITQKNFGFVTCGDWDLSQVLPLEAKEKNIILPSYFSNWINVKKSFSDHSGQFAKGMKDLLRVLQLQHTGRHHSGIDDVENICSIVKAIGQQGYTFKFNGSTTINSKDEGQQRIRLFKNGMVR